MQDIFRIQRKGEFERFETSAFGKVKTSNRRLLWHGSRSTNFGGILSQGLRIAPPEAPVNGYMFGKGVYLADISSKSANYCNSQLSQRTGLLLLCEAELGDPMLELDNADYNAGDRAESEGKFTTLGRGVSTPAAWKDASCVHPSLKGTKIVSPLSLSLLVSPAQSANSRILPSPLKLKLETTTLDTDCSTTKFVATPTLSS